MGRSSLAQLLPSSRLLDFWTLIWHHHLDLCFPVNQWRHIICDLLNIPCPPSIGFMLLINVLWIVWDELKLIWQSESELPIFGKLIQIYMGWNGGTYLSIKTSFHVCACKAWKKAGLAMAHTNYHALSTPFLSSYIALDTPCPQLVLWMLGNSPVTKQPTHPSVSGARPRNRTVSHTSEPALGAINSFPHKPPI